MLITIGTINKCSFEKKCNCYYSNVDKITNINYYCYSQLYVRSTPLWPIYKQTKIILKST